MKKTVAVFDKWISSLGGGEMVACSMAKVLKDQGYDVTFIGGKKVPSTVIKEKLGIDLTGIKFMEIWNDELSLKEEIRDKDLFIDTTFMDYSYGYAKKNLYFTHFPTPLYPNIIRIIKDKYLLPLLIKIVKPVELLNRIEDVALVNGRYAYIMKHPLCVAFSYLNIGKTYQIRFSIFFDRFYKKALEKFMWTIDNANITKTIVKVDHHHNVVHYYVTLIPKRSSIYLNVKSGNHKERVYLIYPRALPTVPITNYYFRRLYEKITNRLRRGIFVNITERLKTYSLIMANSKFTQFFIKDYWNLDSTVLYPPVELLFQKYQLKNIQKNNWITSIGRFFTLGHGKKQEIMIKAFKKLYDMGYHDWQLHLIGGVGDENNSLRFTQKLQQLAESYPVFFHFNPKRSEVEQILLHSKIYWHATGFGENEHKDPIKFEHFGIAPLEAISAGNIPILYNGGGLKEIISVLRLNKKKNLFTSIQQLISNTIYFIEQKNNINWHAVFQNLEKNFSHQVFKSKFLNLVERL
jgi:hypothetical protein